MTAGGKWRNQIVTLLIDRPMTRREIHRALMPLYSTTEEAQIDTSLADMVYAGADLTEAEIEAARKFAIEKPSTSYLQRRMHIPYSHARRLIEYLEAAGVVSAPNSAGLRTVRSRALLHPRQGRDRAATGRQAPRPGHRR